MCDSCIFKQYCHDCEIETEEEKLNNLPNSKSPIQKIIISGNYLYHNGRPYKIIKVEDGNPNKQYYTKSGKIFFIREIGKKIVLIKIQKVQEEKRKPTCREEDCNKILIGPIPHALLQDPNW
jgi:hypothetical protein